MRRNPLARMRVAAGFPNATEAAKQVQCSRIHLLNIERGAAMGSDGLLERMAKAYGTDLETVRRAVGEAREDLLTRQLAHTRERM